MKKTSKTSWSVSRFEILDIIRKKFNIPEDAKVYQKEDGTVEFVSDSESSNLTMNLPDWASLLRQCEYNSDKIHAREEYNEYRKLRKCFN